MNCRQPSIGARFLIVTGIVAATVALAAAQQAQPSFRAGVEVVPVDVGVVDSTGKPIAGLTAADFSVRIGGQPRRVVSAQWVALGGRPQSADIEQDLAPAGFSTNEAAIGGRLIVIAVDQPNIRFGSTTQIMRAVNGLIDTLTPADRVAVVGFGQGSPSTPFLADFEKTKETVARMNGNRRGLASKYSISQSEALGILRSTPGVLESVINRECESARRVSRAALNYCEAEVGYEANELGRQTDLQARETFNGLRGLFTGLKAFDAPKTVILISEGFISDDATTVAQELGTLAASARASLYTMRLDEDVFDLGNGRRPISPSADRRLRANGLEVLSTTAGGDIFTIVASSEQIFRRIESELSGYYLLGVESDPRDADGKTKAISVDVSRRGVLVRAHRQFLDARAASPAGRLPQEAINAALNSPLPMSALPVRVGTFSLQGPERGRVQLLLRAEIGGEYDTERPVTIGFTITDKAGRVIDSQVTNPRLSPAANASPGALQFVGGSTVPPGEYVLKFVAIEGGRAGTVEHAVHAAVAAKGAMTVSDLLVGGPATVDLFTPSAGYTVRYGNVHGYVELYGPQARQATVKYEVAADEGSPAVLSADVQGRPVGDDRVVFSGVVGVKELPPGPYVLRATISAAGETVTTLARAFEVR